MTRFLKSWVEYLIITCVVIGLGIVVSAALYFSYNAWGFFGAVAVGAVALAFIAAVEERI